MGSQWRSRVLLSAAQHLPPGDRALIEGVYDKGLSVAKIARMCSEEPTFMRRKLRRVVERVTSPHFASVLRNQHNWQPDRHKVAMLIFVRGCSHKQAAAQLGVSPYLLRKELAFIYDDLQRERETQ